MDFKFIILRDECIYICIQYHVEPYCIHSVIHIGQSYQNDAQNNANIEYKARSKLNNLHTAVQIPSTWEISKVVWDITFHQQINIETLTVIFVQNKKNNNLNIQLNSLTLNTSSIQHASFTFLLLSSLRIPCNFFLGPMGKPRSLRSESLHILCKYNMLDYHVHCLVWISLLVFLVIPSLTVFHISSLLTYHNDRSNKCIIQINSAIFSIVKHLQFLFLYAHSY